MRPWPAILLGACALAAVAAEPPRATVEVKGLGLIHDLTQKHTLILLLGSERGPVMRAGAVEDAALMIYSSLDGEGYLEAQVRVTIVAASGGRATYSLDPMLSTPLPRPIAAREAIFEVKRGRRFTLLPVTFAGLSAMPADQAQSYFRGIGILSSLTAEQAYSPARLKTSVSNLVFELQQRGYARARATATSVKVDHSTAKVRVAVAVSQGPLWRVTTFRLDSASALRPADLGSPKLGLPEVGKPWNTGWQHDAETALRRWYYGQGRPDVRVDVVPQPGPETDGAVAVTVVAHVVPGPFVRLGAIRFVGDTRTRESVLRPLIHAKPGQPLNLVELQDGQFRMMRLGVFDSVELSFEPATGPVRDAVYVVREGRKQTLDLLLGWGSYDELRGGLEWHDYDLFDRANDGYLKLVQSLKGSSGEYDYSVPEIFGTSADGSAKLFGWDEHLRSFLDQEYGANFAVTRNLPRLGIDLLTGYTLEQLGASADTLATQQTDLKHATVSFVQVAATRDRLDNPLEPRHGYKVYLSASEASHRLGGQVDYQEYQLSASYHTNWGQTRWFHFGFTDAGITTLGAPPTNALPPNVLFYPGGEDSIRGYALGQATYTTYTQGTAGVPIKEYEGDLSYALFSAEFEQALTNKLSAVFFSDNLAASPTTARYFTYRLYSVGTGLNFRTIVGPLRLEYGRNLNPRYGDPRGTVLLSIGFPF